jgi:hypothetical protein
MFAVATITSVRSPGEEARLRTSLERLTAAGLPVSIADTGLSPAFSGFLASLPNARVVVPAEPGLVRQVKASIAIAAEGATPFILYTEPDKEQFFRAQLWEFVRSAAAGVGSQAGVVLAARSDESFRTFPPMQRYTEGIINRLCGDLIAHPGDYSYGPFLLPRSLVPAVAALPDDLGWGWRHRMFVEANRHGLAVSHIVGDFRCPIDQRIEDDAERRHRLRQLSQNILGLIP